VLNPFLQGPDWNQICLVDQEHQVFMGMVFLQMLFQSR
jgi:hypothetical protein